MGWATADSLHEEHAESEWATMLPMGQGMSLREVSGAGRKLPNIDLVRTWLITTDVSEASSVWACVENS